MALSAEVVRWIWPVQALNPKMENRLTDNERWAMRQADVVCTALSEYHDRAVSIRAFSKSLLSLRAQRGNLVGVRESFGSRFWREHEIATAQAPRNDFEKALRIDDCALTE